MILVKTFLKNNFLLIFSFFILFSLFVVSTYNYQKEMEATERLSEKVKKECKSEEVVDEERNEFCKSVMEKDYSEKSFYYAFQEIEYFTFNRVSFLLFILIVTPSIFFTSRYMKNKMIINEATRCDYKHSLANYFKKAYRPVFIVPLLILLSFGTAYLLTGNFNVGIKYINSIPWTADFVSNPWVFITLFILNAIVLSFLYINVSLIVVRKNHNFFVTLILSFLLLYGYDIFLEIFMGGILFTVIFHSDFAVYFNVLNVANFNDTLGLIAPFVVPGISLILSFIILFFKYRNKEKLIIDCEK